MTLVDAHSHLTAIQEITPKAKHFLAFSMEKGQAQRQKNRALIELVFRPLYLRMYQLNRLINFCH